MPRFSANLSFLYPDRPFLERFGAAAADEFKAVEYRSPYEHPVEDLKALLDAHGLEQALFNLPAGDWAGGERGIACLPDRVAEFRDGVDLALGYAAALGCTRINCLAGLAPSGLSRVQLEEVLAGNLAYATQRFAKAGLTLMLEPVNTRDMPGFLIATTTDALRIIDAVGAPNLKVQFDLYHAQIMQGDLVTTLTDLGDRLGHVQVADNPGRREPGTGEINVRFVLEALDRLGYREWVGCEYIPAGDTSAGLTWMTPFKGDRA